VPPITLPQNRHPEAKKSASQKHCIDQEAAVGAVQPTLSVGHLPQGAGFFNHTPSWL